MSRTDGAAWGRALIEGRAVGLNYRAHVDWTNRYHGTRHAVPAQADIGSRAPPSRRG
jgi:hypothetical protein